jgi:hypothetical protein
MKKGYSREIPACIIDLDNLEESVEERKLFWEKKTE